MYLPLERELVSCKVVGAKYWIPRIVLNYIVLVLYPLGIVPILSLYKQHVRNLLRLDPVKYFSDLREREKKARQIENARNPRKGSFAKNIVSCCHHSSEQLYRNGREELEISFRRSIARHDDLKGCNQLRVNMKEMKKAVSRATRSIYGIVFLTGLPVIGVSLFALTVSWNTMPMDIYPGMADILKVFTMIFQALFAIVALFVWNGNNILAYVDVVICLINPFADWYWLKVCEEYVTLRPIDIVTYSLIVLYMTSRLWTKAVTPRKSGFHQSVNRGAVYKMDRFDFVWTTKSASQVSDVIPDILALWNILVDMWGLEDAQNACRISIYVTDKDMEACSMLQREVRNTDLYKSGGIQFQRADLLKVIEDHSIDLICTRRNSQSLLAFCGSPALAREIHRHKISNDMIVAITGNKNHQMDFVSESYGGVKSSNKDKMDETDSEAEGMQPLTTRKNTVYSNRRGLRDLQATKFYSGSKGYSF